MLVIKNTENLVGVSISGDFDDLYNLVDAFHKITIKEYSEKHPSYIDISTRVLGLCYDVRHAYQGDRNVELVDNNMIDEKMKWHSVITSKKNVYYKCDYFYPEMFFVMIALNDLVKLRMRELSKSKHIYKSAMDKSVIWDDTIATIRIFQAEFVKCVKETFTETSFKKWLNLMNGDFYCMEQIAGQYVDMLNIKYINMTKEKRLKNLLSMAKRIAEFNMDDEHKEIKQVVSQAAKKHGCPEGEIRLKGIDYPEEILW